MFIPALAAPRLCAHLVVDHQVPLPAAQAPLGHASVQTKADYARTDLTQLRAFVDSAFSDDVP